MLSSSFRYTCGAVYTARHLPRITAWQNAPSALNITLRSVYCSSRHIPRSIPSSGGLIRSSHLLGTRSITYQPSGPSNILEKDVLLFKYDNPKYFKYLNLFGMSMFLFWTYMGGSFWAMKLTPHPQEQNIDVPWFVKFDIRSERFRHVTGSLLFFLGFAFLALSWMYSLRSVRYLILLKGGNRVSFVTYGPFGFNRFEEFPVENVSCQGSRSTSPQTLPIKVKGKWPYYVLHGDGDYRNIMLFDRTVGINRIL